MLTIITYNKEYCLEVAKQLTPNYKGYTEESLLCFLPDEIFDKEITYQEYEISSNFIRTRQYAIPIKFIKILKEF